MTIPFPKVQFRPILVYGIITPSGYFGQISVDDFFSSTLHYPGW